MALESILLAKQGASEALAPWNGQDAPWPHEEMGAMSSCRHGGHWAFRHAWDGADRGQRGAVGSRWISRQHMKTKIEKQSCPGLVHAPTDPIALAFRIDKLDRD